MKHKITLKVDNVNWYEPPWDNCVFEIIVSDEDDITIRYMNGSPIPVLLLYKLFLEQPNLMLDEREIDFDNMTTNFNIKIKSSYSNTVFIKESKNGYDYEFLTIGTPFDGQPPHCTKESIAIDIDWSLRYTFKLYDFLQAVRIWMKSLYDKDELAQKSGSFEGYLAKELDNMMYQIDEYAPVSNEVAIKSYVDDIKKSVEDLKERKRQTKLRKIVYALMVQNDSLKHDKTLRQIITESYEFTKRFDNWDDLSIPQESDEDDAILSRMEGSTMFQRDMLQFDNTIVEDFLKENRTSFDRFCSSHSHDDVFLIDGLINSFPSITSEENEKGFRVSVEYNDNKGNYILRNFSYSKDPTDSFISTEDKYNLNGVVYNTVNQEYFAAKYALLADFHISERIFLSEMLEKLYCGPSSGNERQDQYILACGVLNNLSHTALQRVIRKNYLNRKGKFRIINEEKRDGQHINFKVAFKYSETEEAILAYTFKTFDIKSIKKFIESENEKLEEV